MTPCESIAEYDEYRLALLWAGARSMLAVSDGASLLLPHVLVRRGTRRAEQLQQSIRETWKLKTLILDFWRNEYLGTNLVVAEAVPGVPSENMIVASTDAISDRELSLEEREALDAILAGAPNQRGPFAQLGWVEEATEWLRTELGGGVRFVDDIRQYSAGGHSALARFSSDQGRSYWLKAAGLIGRHESLVTRTLAELFPSYLPRLIAYRADWNAWLTADAGIPVEDTISLAAFESAVEMLAGLQVASVSHVDQLLACGCADQRSHVLSACVPQLIDYLNKAMVCQTSAKVQPLSVARLHQLGNILEAACGQMEAIGIPDALLHNDLNLGNILLNGSRCVFTDWAEACIGNPFFTFQHLRAQAARFATGAGWVSSLEAIYKAKWSQFLTGSQIENGLHLAPLLAIASHLIGRGEWLSSEQRSQPHIEGYARSLARQMDREARDLRLLGALCM